MREGLAADDIWIMVEDEFLDTAKLFTQHLHHAEYHRLKRLAREKNASATQNIARPVVAHQKMSIESQQKHEARARAERQAEALRQINGESEEADEPEEEAPWARDPYLGGLMSGSQDCASQLSRIAGIKSKTRAAAGYAGAATPKPLKVKHHDDVKSSVAGLAREIRRAAASSDEDDLDGSSFSRRPARKESVRHSSGTETAKARESSMPPPKPSARPPAPNRKSLTKQPPPIREPASTTGLASDSAHVKAKSVSSAFDISKASHRSTAVTSTSGSTRRKLTPRFTFFDDFMEDDDTSKARREKSPQKSPQKSPEKLSRQMTKEKEQKEQKSISADEIPTFLL